MQVVKNIPELVKDIYEIQKSQWNTDKMNNTKATPRNISMKSQNSKDKGKNITPLLMSKEFKLQWPWDIISHILD